MNAVELARIYNEGFEEGKRQAALAAPVQEQAEQLAKLGWQAIECPFCGSSGAQAFAKPATPVPLTEWQQIAEDLRFHGLTLVNTATGYAVLKLGSVRAQTTPPAQPAPVQEPVAWRWVNPKGWLTYGEKPHDTFKSTALYTTPPAAQRQWVGLTLEERNAILNEEWEGQYVPIVRRTVRAIEDKLLEKNAAQPPWIGLTYAEKDELRYSHMTSAEFIDAIEAKLKEKNT